MAEASPQASRAFPGRQQAAVVRQASLALGADERRRQSRRTPSEAARAVGCADLGSGLSSAQAKDKLEEHGPNALQKAKAKSVRAILSEQINVLNMLVVAAGIVCCLQGRIEINGVVLGERPDYFNGAILFIIVGVCAIVGAYMEWSAANIMADVSSMCAPSCEVLRNGEWQHIDTASVVPGDIVMVQMGDAIPADCLVIQAYDLQTNEMALTGEPHDVTKTVAPEDEKSPFPSNMLYATTSVVGGMGRGLVLRTGMDTEIGKIAAHLGVPEMGLTSIQRTLNQIGNLVTMIVSVLVVGIFMVSYKFRVNDPSDPCPIDDSLCFLQRSLLRALFCGVGAIPETLQPACTLLLVIGCRQLREVHAATKKLSAVDTLGSCSFICSDKTGTLTEGKMTCMTLRPRVRTHDPSPNSNGTKRFAFYPAEGVNPRGGIFDEAALTADAKGKLANIAEPEDFCTILPDFGDPANTSLDSKLVRSCMLGFYLNSYKTKLVEEGGRFSIEGNMSEGALVVACAKARFRGESHHVKHLRDEELEVPFSSSRKLSATIHQLSVSGCFEGLRFESTCNHLAILKGAPDVLLPHLSKVLIAVEGGYTSDSKDFNEADRLWFEEQNGEMSSRALRVLCLAVRPCAATDVEQLRSRCQSTDERIDALLRGPLVLLALVGLMDPPRASAQKAIADCHHAGIRVAMVTGDQQATAVAISRSLGILSDKMSSEAKCVSECAALHLLKTNRDIDELCNRIVVWSRAQPSDKVAIVESLQRSGHVVAMTGDGVNDAGALKKADIGLAMGIAGTEVTKRAADIVLLDDRFATIVDANAEGRRIFNNIQRLVAYLLCGNIFDVLVIMFVMAIGWTVPLEETQLFKANFVTHMFYPWCMVFEPASSSDMLHPPHDRSKPILSRLTRHVLMPALFVLYFAGMLGAQAAGCLMYIGTTSRDEQMGTTSINHFYDGASKSACLYASTVRLVSQGDEPDRLQYIRDMAPLHCRVRRLTMRGFVTYSEWGRHGKLHPDEAIQTEEFNWFTGAWHGKFDIQHSFLFPSFAGKADQFQERDWEDSRFGWLAKCSNIGLEGKNKELVVGDSDQLCWLQCGDVPCWQKDLLGNATVDPNTSPEDEPSMKPVLFKKYNAATWGCRQMRSMVLLAMVLMEFTMLYGLSKHECSLALVCANRAFPIMWGPMLLVTLSYVYTPVTLIDQEFAPLDALGLAVALAVPLCFYALFEATKVLHRRWLRDEVEEQSVLAELHSEGKLRAFAGREEAWRLYPDRQPLRHGGQTVGYGSCQREDEEVLREISSAV